MDLPDNYPPEVLATLREHGRHSLAYSIRQPRMRYFTHPGGLIAFRLGFGQCTVLGDPVCASEHAPTLLASFVQRYPNALFMQIHQHTAGLLRGFGYQTTPVGLENNICTHTFSLSGKRMRDLRHYRNRARAGGVQVEERVDSQVLREALKPISDAWLPLKSWWAHELEFLARPFQTQPEPGTRIFVASIGQAPVAFVILDPMYERGQTLGYSVSILRHLPQAPEGTVDTINLQVIETLRAEGIPLLSLGVSPFHRLRALAQEHGRGAASVFLAFLLMNRWGSPIYHFRGLSFHKSRYRAEEIPVFAATRGPLPLLPLFASARACRII